MCIPCVRRALSGRRERVEALRCEHVNVRTSVEEALRRKARSNALKARAAAHAGRLRDLRRRNDRLTRAVEEERRAVADARDRLRAGEEQLGNAFSCMANKRASLLESILPDQLRVQGLNLRMADEQLAVERSRAIAQLRAVFPIAAERRGNATGARAPATPGKATAPTAVRICGLRVPDPGDAVGFQAHELSAGLGVLLHFVDLASRYLAAPTVHRGDARGSASHIWTPGSFWQDEPAAGDTRLPLFLPQKIVEANSSGAGGAGHRDWGAGIGGGGGWSAHGGVSRLVGKITAAAGAVGAAASSAANTSAATTGAPQGGRGDTGSTHVDAAAMARHRAELHRAVALLHRTTAVVCAEVSHALGVHAPEGWGPFASLALLVATLSRSAPPSQREAASQRRAPEQTAPATAERSAGSAADERQRRRRNGGPRYRTWGAWDMRESVAQGTSAASSAAHSLMASVFGGAGESREVKATARAAEGRLEDEEYDGVLLGAEGHVASGSDDAARSRRGKATRSGPWIGAQSVADLGLDGWDVVDDGAAAGGLRTIIPEAIEEEEEALLFSLREEGDANAPVHRGETVSDEWEEVATVEAPGSPRRLPSRATGARAAVLPPPPSRPVDVEHWTRAMYVDARR